MTPESKQDMAKLVDSSRSKCLPRAIKLTTNKQPKNDSNRLSMSDDPRKSSAGVDCREPSKDEDQMMALSANAASTGTESFKEKGGKLIKIEER